MYKRVNFHVDLVMEAGEDPYGSNNCYDWTGKCILVVEDDPLNRYLIQEYLEYTGIEILFAANGKEARETILSSEGIDLILLDLCLPDMNGFEIIKLIKVINPQIPLIIMTALGGRMLEGNCVKYGVKNILKKPINWNYCFHLLNKLIAK